MRYRFTPAVWRGDPATAGTRSNHMKSGIHPEYVDTTVVCSCGNTFKTRSTAKNGVIHADVCSSCHPFYTGKQKILDTGGRVARFERRFGKKAAGGR
jgi:large subunit ribosomal protein L31